MPKYKNVKEFVQPLTINGKRIIVRPGEVIQVSKEIDLNFAAFLEKVDESTPVSKTASAKPSAKPAHVDFDKIKNEVEATRTAIESHATKDDLNKHVETTAEQFSTINKRLEVLKKAVDVLNQALQNMEEVVYNNENFVIEDEK